VTPDGRQVVSASEDGTVKIWDLTTRTELRTFTGRDARTVFLDGAHVISARRDNGTFRILDLTGGVERRTLTGYTGPVFGCAVTADGAHVVSAGRDDTNRVDDDTIRVWDLTTGREVAQLPLYWVHSVAVHPSEPLVACEYGDGHVMVVELMGVDSGPLIVSSVDRGDGPLVRCPACQGERPLDDAWQGETIDCPAGCGRRLRINPFVGEPPRRRRRRRR
jgi:WD40 repeat protein